MPVGGAREISATRRLTRPLARSATTSDPIPASIRRRTWIGFRSTARSSPEAAEAEAVGARPQRARWAQRARRAPRATRLGPRARARGRAQRAPWRTPRADREPDRNATNRSSRKVDCARDASAITIADRAHQRADGRLARGTAAGETNTSASRRGAARRGKDPTCREQKNCAGRTASPDPAKCIPHENADLGRDVAHSTSLAPRRGKRDPERQTRAG